MKKQTHIFISSELNVRPINEWREEIFSWANYNGYVVWNPVAAPELKLLWNEFGTGPEERQRAIVSRTEDICLQAVKNSSLVIAILDKGYGKTHERGLGDISITEMEIVQALLSQIPLYIFTSGEAPENSRLSSLLGILNAAIPSRVIKFPSKIGPVIKIKQIIEDNYLTPKKQVLKNHSKIVAEFCKARHPHKGFPDLVQETGFLENDWIQHHAEFSVNTTAIDELVRKAKHCENYNNRLIYLWRAVRHSAARPFVREVDPVWLARWSEILQEWSSASAWSGLHGHMLIGRRASVVSLLHVQHSMAKASGNRNDHTAYLLSHGGLASEYYSIAKLISQKNIRDAVLCSAEFCVERALSAYPKNAENNEIATQLAILGSVQLLQRKQEAIRHLRRVLDIRKGIGASEGAIADAKSELGYALWQTGHYQEGGNLLKEAVPILEREMTGGFAIRAKRKLAHYCVKSWRFSDAYQQYQQIEALIELHGAAGQLASAENLFMYLRDKLKIPFGKLKAEKTERGYRYQPV